jgi:hypothetical protein
MKIYISKPRDHWISPYTMIDYLFFWKDWSKCSRHWSLTDSLDDEVAKREGKKSRYVERPDWVETWAEKLTPISKAIQKVLDVVHPEVKYIKIDYWDTWSMDHTLSPIILPMLKQLKETKHGSAMVDLEDVPEELRGTTTEDWSGQQTFDFYKEAEKDKDISYDLVHKRWDWVMDEMIFAFECKVDDSWQDQYRSGEIDMVWIPVDKEGNEVPKGEHQYYQMGKGPNDTYVCDYDGIRKVEERIENGFRLFGKYFQGLWD